MKPIYTVAALASLALMTVISGVAHASLTLAPLPAVTEGAIPDSIALTASFTNTSGAAESIVSCDAGFLIGNTITFDDTPFFANYNRLFTADESLSATMLTLLLPTDSSAGIYNGAVLLRGGPSPADMNDLETAPFSVTVKAPLVVPEASVAGPLLLGMSCGSLRLIVRRAIA